MVEMRAVRRRAVLFTLSGVSLIVALLAAEATMTRLGIFAPPNDPMRTERPDLYQADPSVGYRLWPSRTMSYRYPADGPLITLVSNSDGFRSDRELDERDARTRVLGFEVQKPPPIAHSDPAIDSA